MEVIPVSFSFRRIHILSHAPTKAGLFGNASKMKTEVIQEANEFAVVGVTKTEPLRELVWEPRKDPDYERKEIHHRAEDPHIA